MSFDKTEILREALRTLDQPPPPTLHDILQAYRTKGDGDRELLLAMLNAKRSEDSRLAESYGLHRSILDTINQEQSSVYPHHHRLPALTSALHHPSGESYPNKRRSHSPPHRFSPYTRSPPTPPSSDSSDPSFSPKSNSVPIASMLCGSKRASSPLTRRQMIHSDYISLFLLS
ncbi:hypothetical protein BT96DRAFT_870483 [Gymnopus androsaceus JB14]|uniref:Uncharacterized protein n=1 Tax=Gymnopus androsaceus JB14 TaxID=1447944 RepID=A0A6A4IJU4_9AGAR|nr:hypothetical protein BT96DRAFT_870483 [Gymnopus androsaceus JB14]